MKAREAGRAAGMRVGRGLAFVLVGVLLVGGMARAGSPFGADRATPTFSLQAEDVPLGQVVREVSAATGYRVDLPSEWAQEAITARVDRAPLLSGLAQILEAYNHYFITDDEAKTVTIGILGPARGSSASAAPGRASGAGRLSVSPAPGIARGAAAGATSVLRPPAQELQPAQQAGGGAVVIVGSEPAPIDPNQLEVVPPAADGTPAPTLEEVETQANGFPAADPSSIELVPSGHE